MKNNAAPSAGGSGGLSSNVKGHPRKGEVLVHEGFLMPRTLRHRLMAQPLQLAHPGPIPGTRLMKSFAELLDRLRPLEGRLAV